MSRQTTASAVTPERATRLARLIKLIAKTARPRQVLIDKLGIELRGFYRDVKTLRQMGICISARGDAYSLDEDLDEARAKLPCPDPQLTVGELAVLSKGATEAHRKLKRLLESIVGQAAAANGHHKRYRAPH